LIICVLPILTNKNPMTAHFNRLNIHFTPHIIKEALSSHAQQVLSIKFLN
jgi:hypothetical protein